MSEPVAEKSAESKKTTELVEPAATEKEDGKPAEKQPSVVGESAQEEQPPENSFEHPESKDQHSLEHSQHDNDHSNNAISAADNCNVYVAGLPKRATEDMIRKEFSRFGSIQHVNLVRDLETNLSKCFAYVMFGSGVAANDAIRNLNKK